ncbi:RecQ family ATP-dependent DNA helicase NDAI_0F01230 [Naumovozyma dairenensis CBS 421]|uniref:DNA 3'-5' helicase n=1 Tax=Naumovozyma dairenensis (strain ATCC 10597 / BCRC 20456 / CBS 421 / NBRC 0211 / NRRL Y-12639) TaxID=1071378 RepID=G0WCD1_NAUDC|nr:hypothetical protein NDAI_0F01230 [Naumovozyma dairenensis CBS 421]CCD25442.1 hypothetical protein NDAI_0F01230 [Naumovozyma dairenensis CBS 421]
MIKKPSHNLRREHNYLKSNDILQKDKDLVLNVITSKRPLSPIRRRNTQIVEKKNGCEFEKSGIQKPAVKLSLDMVPDKYINSELCQLHVALIKALKDQSEYLLKTNSNQLSFDALEKDNSHTFCDLKAKIDLLEEQIRKLSTNIDPYTITTKALNPPTVPVIHKPLREKDLNKNFSTNIPRLDTPPFYEEEEELDPDDDPFYYNMQTELDIGNTNMRDTIITLPNMTQTYDEALNNNDIASDDDDDEIVESSDTDLPLEIKIVESSSSNKMVTESIPKSLYESTTKKDNHDSNHTTAVNAKANDDDDNDLWLRSFSAHEDDRSDISDAYNDGYGDHNINSDIEILGEESNEANATRNFPGEDSDIVDDHDDGFEYELGDSEIENFNDERENQTQLQWEDELDQDLEILDERNITPLKSPLNNDDHIEEIFEIEDDEDDVGLSIAETRTANVNEEEYRWTEEVYYRLRHTFKLPGFRPNQLEAINSTLIGKDVFVLMPTGGGKSLCYQLPAIVKSGKTKGTSIVISPLISLMQDQVEHLLDLNIKASMISSKGTTQQRKQTFSLFSQGKLDLIYISPEMIASSKQCKRVIKKLYQEGNLARIIVDEAHCVSSWGHDFRPDYKELYFFKSEYPKIPMMVLTATANEHVRQDIVTNLRLRNPVFLKQSFNRTNLFYEVLRKDKDSIDEMIDAIKYHFTEQSGIIYCHSKNSCEKVALQLQNNQIRCGYYHAGMDPDERMMIQRDWQRNKLQVICATVAFGMGIDKSDVRFIYHFTVPRTLEGYYQETGRAGRDGKPSYCIGYYSMKDVRAIQKMIQKDSSLDKISREKHFDKLQEVMKYCENIKECRRKLVLSYFNEEFDRNLCHENCDNCKKCQDVVSHMEDITMIAKDVITLVQSIENETVTSIYCQNLFKGSRTAKIIQAGHDNLEKHGTGKSINKAKIEKIFFHLISERILEEYSITNNGGYANCYVRTGVNSRKVINGLLKVKMELTELRPIPASTTEDNNDGTNSKVSKNSKSKPVFLEVLAEQGRHMKNTPVPINSVLFGNDARRPISSGSNNGEREEIIKQIRQHQFEPQFQTGFRQPRGSTRRKRNGSGGGYKRRKSWKGRSRR